MVSSPVGPDVLDYSDYRLFIKDRLQHLATKFGARCSLRALAKRMDLASPSILSMIGSAKRHLPPDKFAACVEVLGLDAVRAEYFELIYLLARARTEEDRSKIQEKIQICFGSGLFRQMIDDGNLYARFWYLPVLREAVALAGFSPTPKVFARLAAACGVGADEVEQGFRHLFELGLLTKDEAGSWCRSEPSVHNFGRTNAFILLKYNVQLLEQSMKAAVKDNKNRYFESLTCAIPHELFDEFKAHIKRFFKEMDAKAESAVRRERVVQANVQLFTMIDER